jgi:hypothetical protein
MSSNEHALVGYQEIADFLRVPLSTARRKSRELHAAGVLLSRMAGVPPRRVIYTFPSLLIAYCCALEGCKAKRSKPRARRNVDGSMMHPRVDKGVAHTLTQDAGAYCAPVDKGGAPSYNDGPAAPLLNGYNPVIPDPVPEGYQDVT